MNNKELSDSSERVSRHYNAITEQDQKLRRESIIYGLRKFNNWIKAVQIHDTVERVKCNFDTNLELLVMDMCCGKGGDVDKWRQIGISRYIGMDIADSSIQDAKNRHINHQRTKSAFQAHFQCMDCFKTPMTSSIFPWIEESSGCHIISCMFALHYAFENYETAHCALSNISNILLPKGIFIATIPHEETLEEKRKISKSFGNSVYKVEFPSNDVNSFSRMYHFTLNDRVIDCPEYTVPMIILYKLAKQVNLKLLYYETFPDFYEKYKDYPEYRALLHRFDVIRRNEKIEHHGYPKSIKHDEWEVIQLYAVVAFQKL